MSARSRKHFRLWALLGAGQIWLWALHAQPATNPPEATTPDAGGPPVPLLKSPVESFRKLLAMTPAERREAIADRPPETQRQILAKVREYLSLTADERELRLQATELRWYLLPLLNTPATNRDAQLIFIPPGPRKLIQARLKQWDRLPPATQRELLENELTSRYFTQFEISTPQQRTNLLAEIPPERRAQLEAGMARWSALSEGERRKICERFDQFFDLTAEEKQRALAPLPEAERRQIEATLRAFEKLPRAQREQCVRSIEEFASMSLAERQQFLANVERWRQMSPAERQAWRELLAKVPDWPPLPPEEPPLPPGYMPPPPPPPLPPEPPEPGPNAR
jgi:hypothetical protein